jgi:hypothetical protein
LLAGEVEIALPRLPQLHRESGQLVVHEYVDGAILTPEGLELAESEVEGCRLICIVCLLHYNDVYAPTEYGLFKYGYRSVT